MTRARNRRLPVFRGLALLGLAALWAVACGGPQTLGGEGSVCFRSDDCQAGLACVPVMLGADKHMCSADLSDIVSMVDGAPPDAAQNAGGASTGGSPGAAGMSYGAAGGGAPAAIAGAPAAAGSAGKTGTGAGGAGVAGAGAAGAHAGGAAAGGASAGGAPAGGAPAGGGGAANGGAAAGSGG